MCSWEGGRGRVVREADIMSLCHNERGRVTGSHASARSSLAAQTFPQTSIAAVAAAAACGAEHGRVVTIRPPR